MPERRNKVTITKLESDIMKWTLERLSKKELWELYQEREIHLRYVNTMIEDLDEIFNEDKNTRPKEGEINS